MGAIELASQKRAEADVVEGEPLHTSERLVSQKASNCFYVNVPTRVAQRMGLDDDTTVQIDEYRDKIVVRKEE
jgi:hypothetical protein